MTTTTADLAAPLALLRGLRKQGFSLRVRDGKLLVAPVSKLSPEQSAAIKSQREELIALLQWEAEPGPATDDDLAAMWARKDVGEQERDELAQTTALVERYRDWLSTATLPPGPVVVASWLVVEDLRGWQAKKLQALAQWLKEPKDDYLAARCRYGRVLVEMVERVKAVLEDWPT